MGDLVKYLQDPTDPDDQIMVKFFNPLKVVGRGAFSVVLAAFDKLAQAEVAIKIIDKSSFKQSSIELLKKEASILNKLNHPNIIRMKMVYKYKEIYYLQSKETN
jgi:serine/threonine protein kinase